MDLAALPAFRDPLDASTVYVFHQMPELRFEQHEWLRLYDPDLSAFKVRFAARDVPLPTFTTVFGLDGLDRDEQTTREATDWRLNWYRDPSSAWWEQ